MGLPPLGEDASLSLQVARVGWIFALVQRRAKGHPSRFVVARHRLVPDQLSLLLLQLVIRYWLVPRRAAAQRLLLQLERLAGAGRCLGRQRSMRQVEAGYLVNLELLRLRLGRGPLLVGAFRGLADACVHGRGVPAVLLKWRLAPW